MRVRNAFIEPIPWACNAFIDASFCFRIRWQFFLRSLQFPISGALTCRDFSNLDLYRKSSALVLPFTNSSISSISFSIDCTCFSKQICWFLKKSSISSACLSTSSNISRIFASMTAIILSANERASRFTFDTLFCNSVYLTCSSFIWPCFFSIDFRLELIKEIISALFSVRTSSKSIFVWRLWTVTTQMLQMALSQSPQKNLNSSFSWSFLEQNSSFTGRFEISSKSWSRKSFTSRTRCPLLFRILLWAMTQSSHQKIQQWKQ